MIDHLVLAGPSLHELVEWFADTSGVSPSPGGQHLGLGTRNHLVALGGTTYLELIGPDPDQPAPAAPRPFGIDALAARQLVAWCLRPITRLANAVDHARGYDFDPGAIFSMSRRRPDAVLLEWELASRAFDGPDAAPFMIDWRDSPHPTESLDHPVALQSLTLTHPRAEHLADLLVLLDTPLTVERGPNSLSAVLSTPKGGVQL